MQKRNIIQCKNIKPKERKIVKSKNNQRDINEHHKLHLYKIKENKQNKLFLNKKSKPIDQIIGRF